MTTRVAFITPATFDQARGGGERYPLALAAGLVAASLGEVAVELVAPAATPTRQQLAPGVTLRGLAGGSPADAYGDTVPAGLADAVDAADLVHVHQVFTRLGEAAVVAAVALQRPVCVTDHGGTTSTVGRRLGLLEVVDEVVTYSRFGAACLATARAVRIIPGGVDTAFFTPPEAAEIRDTVLFVGRILPHKGIDLLIRACPADVRLVVAGTADHPRYLADLRALAAERGLDLELVLGADDWELRTLYRRALAVVLPSVFQDMYGTTYAQPELMGLVLLEGMACGAPAICTRTGAMPEYVDDGVTGYVIDDVDGLAAALRRLIADPGEVDRLGSRARQRVTTLWDQQVAGAALLDVYRPLLRGDGS